MDDIQLKFTMVKLKNHAQHVLSLVHQRKQVTITQRMAKLLSNGMLKSTLKQARKAEFLGVLLTVTKNGLPRSPTVRPPERV